RRAADRWVRPELRELETNRASGPETGRGGRARRRGQTGPRARRRGRTGPPTGAAWCDDTPRRPGRPNVDAGLCLARSQAERRSSGAICVRAPASCSGWSLAVRRCRRHGRDRRGGIGLPHPLIGHAHAVSVQAIAAGRVADVTSHGGGIHLRLGVVRRRRRHVSGLGIDRRRVYDLGSRGRNDGRADEKASDDGPGAPPAVPAATAPAVASATMPAVASATMPAAAPAVPATVPAGGEGGGDEPERKHSNERQTEDLLHDGVLLSPNSGTIELTPRLPGLGRAAPVLVLKKGRKAIKTGRPEVKEMRR